MDFWCKTVMVAPDSGLCKARTPHIKHWHASQWNTCATRLLCASVDMAHCDYAYTCDLYPQKNNFICVYVDWWSHVNYFDSDKSLFLHKLATQFYVPGNIPRALWPFMTGCVKLQFPSLRRDAWRHNGGNSATPLSLVVVLNIFCRKNNWYKVD